MMPSCYCIHAIRSILESEPLSVHASAHIDPKTGKVLELMTCDNFTFDQPLRGNEIVIPDEVEYVHLRVDVNLHEYHYSYSFDGKEWTQIPVTFYSYKLSDDYIQGGGFFTGAFVGMQCQDTSGEGLHADFDYFTYKEKE
jgi:xylan 1,4-beta-xylosidase